MIYFYFSATMQTFLFVQLPLFEYLFPQSQQTSQTKCKTTCKSALLATYFMYADITIDYKYCFIKISAICTLFNAAPLRTLSETTHISSPLSKEMSSRIRPTKVASWFAPSVTAVG